jgi:AcrR family transcriptional regulator
MHRAMKSTRSDGEATRGKILEVALPLFAAHGYAGTSVRTVAAAAEVNVATLAYHFEDKEGLYETVVQRLHEDLAAGFPSSPPTGPPDEVLRAWVALGWAFARSHRDHIRLLIRHLLDHGALPEIVVERWSERLLSRADAIIAALRPTWPATRRRMLVLSIMHLTVRLVLEDPKQLSVMSGVPVDRLEDEVVDWIASLALRELGLGPADSG